MPFAKRVVEPQFLCRYHIPNTEGVLFDDLFCVNNLALSRSLRQLSDMAQHACSIFKELESELLSNSLRLRGLQSKLNRLQETCSRLDYQLELVREYKNVFLPSNFPFVFTFHLCFIPSMNIKTYYSRTRSKKRHLCSDDETSSADVVV